MPGITFPRETTTLWNSVNIAKTPHEIKNFQQWRQHLDHSVNFKPICTRRGRAQVHQVPAGSRNGGSKKPFSIQEHGVLPRAVKGVCRVQLNPYRVTDANVAHRFRLPSGYGMTTRLTHGHRGALFEPVIETQAASLLIVIFLNHPLS